MCCYGFQWESRADGGGYRALVSQDNNTSLSLAQTTAQTLHYLTLGKQSSSCLSLTGILMSEFLNSEQQTYWRGDVSASSLTKSWAVYQGCRSKSFHHRHFPSFLTSRHLKPDKGWVMSSIFYITITLQLSSLLSFSSKHVRANNPHEKWL